MYTALQEEDNIAAILHDAEVCWLPVSLLYLSCFYFSLQQARGQLAHLLAPEPALKAAELVFPCSGEYARCYHHRHLRVELFLYFV